MWPILKKSNALAGVMQVLMRDFPSLWDYVEVIQKLKRSQKTIEFRKAVMTGDK